MIEFKDIHKKYGKLEVLKGVNFTIKDGGIIAIFWEDNLHEEFLRHGGAYQRGYPIQWEVHQRTMGL